VVLDILKYDVIRDIATCSAKVAKFPEISAPIALLQFWVFLLHSIRRAAVHAPDHITDRKLRRDRYHHMDAVTGKDIFDNLDAQLFANLTYDILYSYPNLALKHLVAIFGDLNDVIPMVENRATAGVVGNTVLQKIDLAASDRSIF